jgi:hypothetical protein
MPSDAVVSIRTPVPGSTLASAPVAASIAALGAGAFVITAMVFLMLGEETEARTLEAISR